MQLAAQTRRRTNRNVRPRPCDCCILAFILALTFAGAGLRAAPDDPPADLAKKVAARESENEAARNQYTYRQTVILDELGDRGMPQGEYKEVRDVIFSPTQERTEQFVGKPSNGLQRLTLTEEDFRDLREVQPFLLTTDRLFLYETRFRGEETIDNNTYWVLQIRPRQLLEGQRLFDGLIWIDKKDCSIVRCEGQAVPQIVTSKSENLFPRFTTVREKLDGSHWFPVKTYANDTLPFRNGPIRVRLTILYSQYKRFGAESVITYGK